MFRNGLQPTHVIVVVVVILLLFGSTKLPALAKSLGQSLKIFKKEVEGLTAGNGAGAAGDARSGSAPSQERGTAGGAEAGDTRGGSAGLPTAGPEGRAGPTG
jgi:sec-independent protein translocase protein TatA